MLNKGVGDGRQETRETEGDLSLLEVHFSSFEADGCSSEVKVPCPKVQVSSSKLGCWSSKVKISCIASNAPRTGVQVSPFMLGC